MSALSYRLRLAAALIRDLSVLELLSLFDARRAAAWANRQFWFRPQRRPPSPHSAKYLEGACTFTVPHRGGALRVLEWGAGPAVLLVHGWSGRWSQLGELAAAVASNGYRAVAFDAPAHGDAPGLRTDFPEITEAVTAVGRACGELDAVIAHSAGCVAALRAHLAGLATNRIVCISPYATLDHLLTDFARKLRLSPAVASAQRALLESRYGPQVYREYSPAWLVENTDTPGLVVHDHDDDEVAAEQGAAVHERWKGSRLLNTVGLGHYRLLRDRQVLSDIVRFISEERRVANAF